MKHNAGKMPQGGPKPTPDFARSTGMPEHLKAKRGTAPDSGQTKGTRHQTGNAGNEPTS